jgi:hypothetical protein
VETLIALFGWTSAGTIMFLLAGSAGVAVGLLNWAVSRYKNASTLVGSVICFSFLLLVGVGIAGVNASEHDQKQRTRAGKQAQADWLAMETRQAESDLAQQGFTDDQHGPVSISVLGGSVSFHWYNCSFILELEKIDGRYAITLFQTLTPRPLRPDEIPTIIRLGCEQP